MQLLGADDGRLPKPTHRFSRASTLERAGRAPHYPSIRAVAVQPSSRSPPGLSRCPHALHPLWQARMEPFLARSGGSEASEASRAGGGCGASLPASPAAELRRKQVRATSAAPRAPRSPPLARPGHGPPRAPRVHRRRAVAPLEARPDCPHPPHRSWRQRGRLGPRAGRAQLIPGLLSLRGGVGAQRLLASRTRR